MLEGGVHVPFLMTWQGVLPMGKIYRKPVSSLDLTPTFVNLAGGKFPKNEFDGTDLIPYILRKKREAPHRELKWRFTISAAIRQGDWKLIRLPDRLPLLYHLPSDPSEQKNVALEKIDKTKKLLKKLGNWDVRLPHPLFLEGAKWKKRQLRLYDRKYQLTQP